MSKSDFDPSQLDLSRITFALQDGVDQFEATAREFLPVIFGLAYDDVILTDESSLGDFRERCETREQYEAWERKILQRIEDRFGVRPESAAAKLVDLFRDIEFQRRGSTRQ